MSENNWLVIKFRFSVLTDRLMKSCAVVVADCIDGRWAQGGGGGEHVAGYE